MLSPTDQTARPATNITGAPTSRPQAALTGTTEVAADGHEAAYLGGGRWDVRERNGSCLPQPARARRPVGCAAGVAWPTPAVNLTRLGPDQGQPSHPPASQRRAHRPAPAARPPAAPTGRRPAAKPS